MSEATFYVVGGITISRQALIIMILGAIQAIVIWGLILANATVIPPVIQFVLLLGSLMYLGIAIYQAYVTNCVLVGSCKTLSWYLVLTYALATMWVPIYFYSLIVSPLRSGAATPRRK